MKTSVDGIVIWQVKTGEADRVITLLTPAGLVTAYARGSLKPGGKLTGSTAMLTYSNFELASGKSMYTVADATSQNKFSRIYIQPEKSSLAYYFCELLRDLAPTEEDSTEYLSLFLNCLYLLDGDIKPEWMIKAVFEMRVMSLAGYMPDVAACAGCGREDSRADVFFDPLEAVWLCSDCLKGSGRVANYSYSVMAAVRHIVMTELKRSFSFELGEDAQKQLVRLCEEYVLAHLERKPKTLDFYKSLK